MERERKEKGTRWSLESSKELNKPEFKMMKNMFDTIKWSADDASASEMKALTDIGEIPQSAKECLDEVSGFLHSTHNFNIECFKP